MIISLIAAQAKNRVIGLNNQLPWDLPEDLNYFKEKTKGKIIIMGRKTFESLPKLLPKRLHIVISRNTNQSSTSDLVKYVSSVNEALKLAQSFIPLWPEEVFIIGGGEIYNQSLPYAHLLYLTEIDKDFTGDAYFPIWDKASWTLYSKIQGNPQSSQNNNINYDFCIYQNKNPLPF
ncbi:MAG: dihydrofolate reductase [Bdellovibrionaceae bacterium]|nr:dihydrofolate reductase [Pseudobdellovibrionaceae bacterium]NUM60471.1 dihydrofolate reductase [Pseudobdellovibrionaceae bacterium]